MKKLLLALFLSYVGSAFAQISGGGISNVPALIDQRGTTLPSRCTLAQLFFKTDATAGGNVYGCTSANTWTAQGSSLPGGSNTQVQYNSSGAFAGSANMTFDAATPSLLVGTGSGAAMGIRLGGQGGGFGHITSSDNTAGSSTGIYIAGSQQVAYSPDFIWRNAGGTTQMRLGQNVAGQGLTIGAGTAITDVNGLLVTQTWNEGSTAFTAIKANVTNTASSTSKLIDLQVDSTTKFSVDKTGLISTAGGMNITSGNILLNAGSYIVPDSGYIFWASRATLQSPADGVLTLFNNGLTDWGRLQFGGTTSSFPSIKRSGAGLVARLADDSANANVTMASLLAGAGNLVISATAPTIASGLCTSPAVSASNGTAAFALTVGTSCTAVTTGTLTMPAATTGWVCHFNNVTNPANSTPSQTGGSTTTVTFTNYARTTGLAADFTASDSIRVMCSAY